MPAGLAAWPAAWPAAPVAAWAAAAWAVAAWMGLLPVVHLAGLCCWAASSAAGQQLAIAPWLRLAVQPLNF